MKISVSLPQELVNYIDSKVDNRSKLIKSLLLTWQKQQQKELMLAACLALDEQQSTEEAESNSKFNFRIRQLALSRSCGSHLHLV